MAFPIAASIAAGSNILGGMLSNKASAKAAAAERSWQEYMSNTAHQREVKDLKAAGLNPILSAKYGGASTGHAGIAQVKNIFDGVGDTIMQSSAQGIQRQQTKSNIELQKSQQLVNSAQTQKLITDRDVSRISGLGLIADIKNKNMDAQRKALENQMLSIAMSREGAKKPYYDSWIHKFLSPISAFYREAFSPLDGLFNSNSHKIK